VFGSVARREARPDSDLDLLVDFEPGAFSLITSLWSRTLRNFWAVELTRLRDTPSSLRTNAFARRPWICDQGAIISSPIS
jgi:predicted nucleotidyltransferase